MPAPSKGRHGPGLDHGPVRTLNHRAAGKARGRDASKGTQCADALARAGAARRIGPHGRPPKADAGPGRKARSKGLPVATRARDGRPQRPADERPRSSVSITAAQQRARPA